jgi:aspartyl-tRNA(Asn)/glutamyl-tRNA(Gln) amidotransferase subunit C
MPITPEEIHILAAEAKLKITQEEMPYLLKYLNNFLTELERMNELELEDVHLFGFTEADSCHMREDNIVEFPFRGDILAAAPDREGDYFRVARILDK